MKCTRLFRFAVFIFPTLRSDSLWQSHFFIKIFFALFRGVQFFVSNFSNKKYIFEWHCTYHRQWGLFKCTWKTIRLYFYKQYSITGIKFRTSRVFSPGVQHCKYCNLRKYAWFFYNFIIYNFIIFFKRLRKPALFVLNQVTGRYIISKLYLLIFIFSS